MRTLQTAADVQRFFRDNQTPIYYVNTRMFNLLGVDECIGGLRFLNAVDSFDGRHPYVFIPDDLPADCLDSFVACNNALLSHPAVAEQVRENGPGGKVLFLMFDEETERLAARLDLEVSFPSAALRHHLDSKLTTTRLANKANAHFHVDAAWGGPLLFSDEYRSRLAGIERADSVTIDGHKQLYLPLGIGLVLFRQPQFARAIEKHAHYLSRPGSADLGMRSLEGSRPGTALYLHAALNIIGRDGYAALVNDSIRKVRYMADTICVRPEFELLMEPDSNVLLYRYLPETFRMDVLSGDLSAEQNQALNRLNERLHKAQRQAGRTYVSRTTLFNTRYGPDVPVVAFRAVVANPLTSEGDLAAVLEDQRELGVAIESER